MIRMPRLSRLAAATGGASAVEFALVAALFLLPLTLGLFDVGSALYSWMEVGNAARAGAQYVNINGYSSTYKTSGNTCPATPVNTPPAVGFTCATQTATNLGSAVSVSVGAAYCGCHNGTTYTAQAYAPPCGVCPQNTPNCCPAGQTALTLVDVTATYKYVPIFDYLVFNIVNGFTLSAQSTALIY
jgi:Flp pilus assembly protein TadG